MRHSPSFTENAALKFAPTKAIFTVFTLSAIALFSSGCSLGSYYQAESSSLSGIGHSDMALGNNTYLINFKYTDPAYSSTARDFATLRATEVCMNNGFTSFIVIDESDSANPSSISKEGTINQSINSKLKIKCFKEASSDRLDAKSVNSDLKKKYKI